MCWHKPFCEQVSSLLFHSWTGLSHFCLFAWLMLFWKLQESINMLWSAYICILNVSYYLSFLVNLQNIFPIELNRYEFCGWWYHRRSSDLAGPCHETRSSLQFRNVVYLERVPSRTPGRLSRCYTSLHVFRQGIALWSQIPLASLNVQHIQCTAGSNLQWMSLGKSKERFLQAS